VRQLILYILLFAAATTYGQEASDDWSDEVTLVNQEKINTQHTEFSPSYWNDLIVFVASRPRNKILDKNIKEAFFDLYFAAGKREDELTKTALFSKNINTPTHEGPITFSNIDYTAYFTRTQLDGDNIVRNKIFKSKRENDDWTEGELLNINQESTASCHPTISKDGQIIIFASERPEGFGKMDLYYSIKENGNWQEPKNLGPEINSAENELFPFISDRGILFFSSDRSGKKSGLNIFSTIFNLEGKNVIQELPAPFNTQHDDFGLITGPKGTTGYLSSNRPGGKGKDDIYFFKTESSLFSLNDASFNVVSCIVKDENQNPINNCTIKFRALSSEESKAIGPAVFTFDNKKFETASADKNGQAFVQLSPDYTLIEVSAIGKKPWYKILSGKEAHETINISLEQLALEPATTKSNKPPVVIEKHVASINNVKLNVGSVVVFNNIYYDYNSDDIKMGAAKELDQLATIMLDNNDIKILLSAHTDARGQRAYNQALSERRALAAKNYLVRKGVTQSNIRTIGFGESKLRNHCKDSVKCSEAEHVYNRRTEVTVLER